MNVLSIGSKGQRLIEETSDVRSHIQQGNMESTNNEFHIRKVEGHSRKRGQPYCRYREYVGEGMRSKICKSLLNELNAAIVFLEPLESQFNPNSIPILF